MKPVPAEEAARALACARAAIEAEWSGAPPPPAPAGGVFDERCGVFVTLHKAGHLRGCIGRPLGDRPLGAALREVALEAAFDDPRFPPLRPDEWPQVELEISLLEEPRPVAGPGGIEAGRHGVLLDCDGRRALFLPQVAAEQGWTREELLAALCRKAGLPRDAWQRPGCRLRVFEARVLR